MTVAHEGYHLDQTNIAKIRHSTDDPRSAGFVDNLDRINGLGIESPGCVWIYSDDSGAAIDTKMFDDPNMLLNLTVWESIEDFNHFVTKTDHVSFLRRTLEWFDRLPDGLPTPQDAIDRVCHLRDNGPSSYAFTMKDRFPPEE